MNRNRVPAEKIVTEHHTWYSDDYFCIHCGSRQSFRLEETDLYSCSACGLTFVAYEQSLPRTHRV